MGLKDKKLNGWKWMPSRHPSETGWVGWKRLTIRIVIRNLTYFWLQNKDIVRNLGWKVRPHVMCLQAIVQWPFTYFLPTTKHPAGDGYMCATVQHCVVPTHGVFCHEPRGATVWWLSNTSHGLWLWVQHKKTIFFQKQERLFGNLSVSSKNQLFPSSLWGKDSPFRRKSSKSI